MEGAVKHVIFPAYEPFLLASALSDCFFGMVILFVDVSLEDSNEMDLAFLIGACYACQHFVLEGVALCLYQPGCGYDSAARAAKYACCWGLFTFFMVSTYFMNPKETWNMRINFMWNIILMVCYLLMWILPDTVLYRRNALVYYCKIWFLFRFMAFIAFLLQAFTYDNDTKTAGECLMVFTAAVAFGFLKPFVLYHTLLADSHWWQGALYLRQQKSHQGSLGIGSITGMSGDNRDVSNDTESSQDMIHSPLFGIEVGYDNAMKLGEEMENISNKGKVRKLNSAFISISKNSSLLGSGSFSKVYRGKYKGDPVAIKMLVTPDLTGDVIRRCSSEAEILSQISHPNVVRIFGISVLPPSVCIVLEICQFGSLADATRGVLNKPAGLQKRPLLLSTADKIFLALGCCRGLAALHSISPLLCHRDVKSFNFLVDSQLNAKIADLELGGEEYQVDAKKDGQLVCWLAPEILSGEAPTQAADVYSLSLVLWEIFAGSAPFDKTKFSEIDQLVLSGQRPFCPPGMIPFQSLVEEGWSHDLTTRPTAQYMAEVVESYYRACLSPVLRTTALKLDTGAIRRHFNANKRLRMKHLYALPFAANGSNFKNQLGRSDTRKVGGSMFTPKQPAMKSPMFNSGKTIPIERGSTKGRLGESINAILKFDEEEARGFNHNQDPLLLPTISNAVTSWQQLDTDLGACLVLTGEECVFNKVKGSNREGEIDNVECVGFKRPDGPCLALYSSQEFTKMTGYLLGDIVASDLACIKGSRTDKALLDHTINQAMDGKTGHAVLWFKRRDNNHFLASLHAFPIYSSDLRDHKLKKNRSPKRSLSSLFTRKHRNTIMGVDSDSIMNSSKELPRPLKMKTPLSQNITIGEAHNRDSDIMAFRPSYLLHNDSDESSIDATDTSRLLNDSDVNGSETHMSTSVVQGNVSLSIERQELYNEEARWVPISEEEYATSPVLFIVLNFKLLIENS